MNESKEQADLYEPHVWQTPGQMMLPYMEIAQKDPTHLPKPSKIAAKG